MRTKALAFVAVAMLLSAPPAIAAPTCQNRLGDTARCGTEGAMPVGWSLPERERMAVDLARPPGPAVGELFALACVLAAFFALIALMPDFDGASWDAQEGDEEERS